MSRPTILQGQQPVWGMEITNPTQRRQVYYIRETSTQALVIRPGDNLTYARFPINKRMKAVKLRDALNRKLKRERARTNWGVVLFQAVCPY